jgi:hypothetical protein
MGRRWTYRPPSFRAWINKLRRRPVSAEGEIPVAPGAPIPAGIRRLRKDELVSFGLSAKATVGALIRVYRGKSVTEPQEEAGERTGMKWRKTGAETVSLTGFSNWPTVRFRRLRIDPVASGELR